MQLLSKQFLHIPNTCIIIIHFFVPYLPSYQYFRTKKMTLFQNTNGSFWVQARKGNNAATITYLIIYDKDE